MKISILSVGMLGIAATFIVTLPVTKDLSRRPAFAAAKCPAGSYPFIVISSLKSEQAGNPSRAASVAGESTMNCLSHAASLDKTEIFMVDQKNPNESPEDTELSGFLQYGKKIKRKVLGVFNILVGKFWCDKCTLNHNTKRLNLAFVRHYSDDYRALGLDFVYDQNSRRWYVRHAGKVVNAITAISTESAKGVLSMRVSYCHGPDSVCFPGTITSSGGANETVIDTATLTKVNL